MACLSVFTISYLRSLELDHVVWRAECQRLEGSCLRVLSMRDSTHRKQLVVIFCWVTEHLCISQLVMYFSLEQGLARTPMHQHQYIVPMCDLRAAQYMSSSVLKLCPGSSVRCVAVRLAYLGLVVDQFFGAPPPYLTTFR